MPTLLDIATRHIGSYSSFSELRADCARRVPTIRDDASFDALTRAMARVVRRACRDAKLHIYPAELPSDKLPAPRIMYGRGSAWLVVGELRRGWRWNRSRGRFNRAAVKLPDTLHNPVIPGHIGG